MPRASRSLFLFLFILLTQPAQAILDKNSNGLSDFWERGFNNGSLFDESFDPQADSDLDGWSNIIEATAGTHPFVANPPDGIIRPTTAHVPAVWSEPDEFNEIHLESPEAVIVTWPTLAGKQYTLFFSPDLTVGSWLPVGPPFIAFGGESEYGFPINDNDKRFWRVAVEDIDSDSDTLTNHEESLANTNPTLTDTDSDTLSDHAELVAGTDPLQADADGDGWTDPQELAVGTDSRNQDTDGDGIPDSIDSQPLGSAIAFTDTDGDGIPNGNDPAPNDPRGPAPSITLENASGNPLSNLIKDETVKFILTVSNPSGPAPTASDLTFFLNGTEEANPITAIGNSGTSTQRFLLSWTAKTTATYPSLTLQNLTLRFRDAQQATSWTKLARIDVAEWEGMLASLRKGNANDINAILHVVSHFNGVKSSSLYYNSLSLYRMSPGDSHAGWYRGPKEISFLNGLTGGLLLKGNISEGMRYPLFLISAPTQGPAIVAETISISSSVEYANHGIFLLNNSGFGIRGILNPGGTCMAADGQSSYLAVPEQEEGATGGAALRTEYLKNGEWTLSTAGTISRFPAQSSTRKIWSSRFYPSGLWPGWRDKGMDLTAPIEAQIIPHASGSLEYPSLPLPVEINTNQIFSPNNVLLPISQGAWHKIVFKVGPDSGSVSNGIGLWLRKGQYGDALPQAGFTLKVQGDNGALEDLTVPQSGKIPFAADSPNWQRLTSPSGLTVFIARDETVTDIHDLSLQLLKKREWHPQEAVQIASIDIIPADTVVGDAQGIELAPEGFVTAAANPTPSVEITVTSSTVQSGILGVRLQGTVKDSVSRFAQSAAERPQTLNFYHQGELLHSIPLDETVGDEFVFDEIVEIPNPLPQTYIIRAETTENIAGNKGYDESSVSLTWEDDPSSFPTLSAPLSIAFASAPSDGIVDQATLFVGSGSPQAGDTASAETLADSLKFDGSLSIPTGVTSVTAPCQLKLQYLPVFSATEPDSIVVNIEFTAPGFPNNHLYGRWTETGANTLIFRPGNWTFGNQVLKISQTAHQNLRGTPPSEVEACTIRFPNLPPSLVNSGLQVVTGGSAYDLIEIGGIWYPEDPDKAGEIKRFTPSAYPLPARLQAPGQDPEQGFLKFYLRYPGTQDVEAGEIFINPCEDAEEETSPPPLAARRIYSLETASEETPPPWEPGNPVIPEHVIWAYRFLNANDTFAIELLDGYLRGGHKIETADVVGDLDLDVTLNDLITDEDNIWTIQIEEDINPVHAARLLFEGLKQASPYKEVFDNYSFADPMDAILAFKAAMATAVQKTQETAIAATEIYLSGLGIVNEGLDWIIVINDVSEGHWESLAAAAPFISSGLVKSGGFLKIRKLSGEVTDTLNPAGIDALKQMYRENDLRVMGITMDEFTFSENLRKALSTSSGPVTPPTGKMRDDLRKAMEALGPKSKGKYTAHHDFIWAERDWFARRGINVNNPAFGRWASKYDHQTWHSGIGMGRGGRFNDEWRNFINNEQRDAANGVTYTYTEIIDKLANIRAQFPVTGGHD